MSRLGDQIVYQKMSNQKISLVFICFNILLLLHRFRVATASRSLVRSLPGFDGPLPFELETGYIGIDGSELFYYFIKSERKPSEDPLLLWLSGGPGCSSLSGLLFGVGPLDMKKVKYDGSLPSLVLNPYSWTKVSNIIFVDAPVGTGFSYSRSLQGSYTGDTVSANQTYYFLLKWLLNHPEFLSNPLYVGGDSYSGLTNPLIVKHIADGIDASQEPFINLKGYLLGNPLTDRHIAQNSRIPFAYGMGLLSHELYESVKKSCKEEYINVDPSNEKCIKDLQAVSKCTSRINPSEISVPLCPEDTLRPNRRIKIEISEKIKFSDILEPFCPKDGPRSKEIIIESESLLSPETYYVSKCREYSFALTYYWANDERVQRALNIRKGWKKEWTRCKWDGGLNYTYDVKTTVPHHRSLSRRNYRSLIYNGDHDLRVPFLSTHAWIRSLNYPIIEAWRPWFLDDHIAGYTMTYANNMTFATVKEAGHIATETLPKQCLAMFTKWILNDPL